VLDDLPLPAPEPLVPEYPPQDLQRPVIRRPRAAEAGLRDCCHAAILRPATLSAGQRPQTGAPVSTAIIWATGGKQYRQLADEYRRLAGPATTAREHTDLKLGELSPQLDYLRDQNK